MSDDSKKVTKPWNVSDEVANVPPEGDYTMRINSVEAVQSKNGNDAFKIKCTIVGGDEDGKNQTYTRPYMPSAIGIIARDMMNSGEEWPDPMPYDHKEVASLLEEKWGGHLYRFELKHGEYQGRKNGNWTLTGPVSSL